ncbi:MAG: hypothetical protein WDW38_008227 [Sanguina aurantia]
MEGTITALRGVAQEVMDYQASRLQLNDIKDLQQQGMQLLLQLKEDSRNIAYEGERQREETSKSKKQLEEAHLSLQNLVYEKQYYDQEIHANLSYRPQHSDDAVALIPEEQFMAEASPEVLARVSAGDRHTVMLERLQHELRQRKALVLELDVVKQQKLLAQNSMAKRQEALDGLHKHLHTLKESARPLQPILAPHLMSMQNNAKSSHLLPLPLYILFSQLTASQEALSLPIKVSISGSVPEAEAAASTAVAAADDLSRAASAGVTGNSKGRGKARTKAPAAAAVAAAEAATAAQAPRPHGGAESGPASMQIDGAHGRDEMEGLGGPGPSPPTEDLYKPHPLTVILELRQQQQPQQGGSGGAPVLRSLMILKFQWLPYLKVLTAHSDVAADNSLLEKLVPGDGGDGATFESLAQLESGTFVYRSSRASKPYRWCQHLGGLDFVPPLPLCTLLSASEQASVMEGLPAYRQQLRISQFIKLLTDAKAAQSARA